MLNRRHPRTAMVRAVKTSTMRATKKARATKARETRVMMETSPREEGEDGQNNQLGTKVAATVRTVVASYGR